MLQSDKISRKWNLWRKWCKRKTRRERVLRKIDSRKKKIVEAKFNQIKFCEKGFIEREYLKTKRNLIEKMSKIIKWPNWEIRIKKCIK